MTTRAAIATTTSVTTIASTATVATIASVVAAGLAARAEVAELTGDLAVERVFEAHRHGAARTRTVAC